LPAIPKTSSDWLILQLVDNRPEPDRLARPTALTIDLRAAPIACKTLRDAVMSGYGQAGLVVPEWVSGHLPDGAPSKAPHLAVIPLAFAGYPHADGRLLGFGLIPPAGHVLLDDDDFRAAMRALLSGDLGELSLKLRRTGELRLTPTFDATARSLQPSRYCCTAYQWTTLTPLVLDRHLKAGDGPAEMQAIVARAGLRATGVPTTAVVVHKHAAIEGAPSAAPSGRAPRWTGWTVPDKLRSRRLVHATLVFEEPVKGPLLLGAGRFYGLGLCLPVPEGGS
jgi:CRISPR-associated protein Csb2